MKQEVTLNSKEQKRLMIMNEIVAGRITGQQAADVLGITLRHTRRILARYRQKGAAALALGFNKP
jgi:CRP-like cAMP-binding protein